MKRAAFLWKPSPKTADAPYGALAMSAKTRCGTGLLQRAPRGIAGLRTGFEARSLVESRDLHPAAGLHPRPNSRGFGRATLHANTDRDIEGETLKPGKSCAREVVEPVRLDADIAVDAAALNDAAVPVGIVFADELFRGLHHASRKRQPPEMRQDECAPVFQQAQTSRESALCRTSASTDPLSRRQIFRRANPVSSAGRKHIVDLNAASRSSIARLPNSGSRPIHSGHDAAALARPRATLPVPVPRSSTRCPALTHFAANSRSKNGPEILRDSARNRSRPAKIDVHAAINLSFPERGNPPRALRQRNQARPSFCLIGGPTIRSP